MGLKTLIEDLRKSKPMRKTYKIKPKVCFYVDNVCWVISLIPTIIYEPWTKRNPGSYVFDIMWLNFHLLVGQWTTKD